MFTICHSTSVYIAIPTIFFESNIVVSSLFDRSWQILILSVKIHDLQIFRFFHSGEKWNQLLLKSPQFHRVILSKYFTPSYLILVNFTTLQTPPPHILQLCSLPWILRIVYLLPLGTFSPNFKIQTTPRKSYMKYYKISMQNSRNSLLIVNHASCATDGDHAVSELVPQ